MTRSTVYKLQLTISTVYKLQLTVGKVYKLQLTGRVECDFVAARAVHLEPAPPVGEVDRRHVADVQRVLVLDGRLVLGAGTAAGAVGVGHGIVDSGKVDSGTLTPRLVERRHDAGPAKEVDDVHHGDGVGHDAAEVDRAANTGSVRRC